MKETDFNVQENPLDITIARHVHHFFDSRGKERDVEIAICPHCRRAFGVDSEYLNRADGAIHCPMCRLEVTVLLLEDKE